MKNKTIRVTLQQNASGNYSISQLTNAIAVELSTRPPGSNRFELGEEIEPKDAQAICSSRDYEVTVKARP